MDSYIEILKIILKTFNNQCDDMIKNILIKIFDIYFLERDIQKQILITHLKNIILICIIH